MFDQYKKVELETEAQQVTFHFNRSFEVPGQPLGSQTNLYILQTETKRDSREDTGFKRVGGQIYFGTKTARFRNKIFLRQIFFLLCTMYIPEKSPSSNNMNVYCVLQKSTISDQEINHLSSKLTSCYGGERTN